MSISTNAIITFNGQSFHGASRLGVSDGSFVLELFTTPDDGSGYRGTFFTIIPISTVASRQVYPTRARLSYCEGYPNRLIVIDDWGNPYHIQCDDEYHSVISSLLNDVAEGLSLEIVDGAGIAY